MGAVLFFLFFAHGWIGAVLFSLFWPMDGWMGAVLARRPPAPETSQGPVWPKGHALSQLCRAKQVKVQQMGSIAAKNIHVSNTRVQLLCPLAKLAQLQG